MAFNPDAYLAKKTKQPSSGFDPDAYLSKKSAPKIQQEDQVEQKKPAERVSLDELKKGPMSLDPEKTQQMGQAILSGRTLGLSDAAIAAAKSAFSPSTYGEELEKIKQERQQNKAAELAGALSPGGLLGATSGAIGRAVSGAERLKKSGEITKAGITGLGTSGAYAGYERGIAEPLGLINKEDIPDLKYELAGGALLGGGLQAVGGAISAIPKVSGKLSKEMAVDATGASKKTMKELGGKVEKTGDILLKNKIVQAGDKVEDINAKASKAAKESWGKLNDLYSNTTKKLNDPAFLEKLPPKLRTKIETTRLDPQQFANEALSQLKNKMKGKSDAIETARAAEGILANLRELNSVDDLLAFQTFKSDLATKINWGKQTNDLPANQEARKIIHDLLKDKIEKRIKTLGAIERVSGGNKNNYKNLVRENENYGAFATARNASKDRLAAIQANTRPGLRETIVGAGVGGLTAGQNILEGDIEGAAKGVALGLGAAGATRLAQRYGPSAGAGLLRGVESISKPAGLLGEEIKKRSGYLLPAVQKGLLQK